MNQAAASGSSPLSYDGRGNLVSDGTRTLGYSSENLLVSRTVPGQAPVIFTYDPLMRLHDGHTTPTDATRFEYDGDTIVAEKYQGRIAARFVHGPGIDEPLVTLDRYGNRAWLHADERGSIVAVTNPDGTARTITSYDEYGLASNSNGRFQYTGQIGLTGDFYSYKARMYDPRLGRFLQSDPIGYGDGMNMYAYVAGDPVNLSDPTGLRWRTKCVGDETGFDCGKYWEEESNGLDVPALLPRGRGEGGADGSGPGGRRGPTKRRAPPPPPPPPPLKPEDSKMCKYGKFQEKVGQKETEVGGGMMLTSNPGLVALGTVLVATGLKDLWIGQGIQFFGGCK